MSLGMLILADAASTEWMAVGSLWSGILAAIIAVGATFINYQMFRSQIDPDVIVYVKHDDRRPSVILLVIENVGKGLARNVRFKASRTLPFHAFGLTGSDGEVSEMTEGPFVHGIPALGPGASRQLTWGQFGGLHDYLGNDPIVVTITYESKSPWSPVPHLHENECPVDIASFALQDSSDHNYGKKCADSLKSLAESMARMERHLLK